MHAAKTRAAFSAVRGGSDPRSPEGPGPRFCGTVGSLPPLLVSWPPAGSPGLPCPSCCFLCCLRFGLGDAGGEISSERSFAHTFPGRFHQTVRMPLEESYLAVHGSEDKRHGLRPSQRFVFLPDLIEVPLCPPSFACRSNPPVPPDCQGSNGDRRAPGTLASHALGRSLVSRCSET